MAHENDNFVNQYVDLAEVSGTDCLKNYTKDQLAATVKTQFVFGTTVGGYNDRNDKYLEALDFKYITSMNNWYPGHRDQKREIRFWWKRMLEKQETKPLFNKVVWGGTASINGFFKSHPAHLQASGCGFLIGCPPLHARLFYRYHTLLRMPVILRPSQKLWLDLHNFQHIDTGDFASYYINGWNPYKWDIEEKFWYEKGVSINALKVIKDPIAKAAAHKVARQQLRSRVEIQPEGKADAGNRVDRVVDGNRPEARRVDEYDEYRRGRRAKPARDPQGRYIRHKGD